MAGATWAVRRWGPAVGGWIVGLPLTSGPIAFFLALELGPAFAVRAAVSTLLGINAVAATVVTYALLARRWHWGATTAASVVAFALTAAALAMVLTITALAESLGPKLSGLISPFPVFTLVMAVFSHRHSGGAVAVPYARGLLASLVGFAVFFLVIATTLRALGMPAFLVATVAALVTSGGAALVAARFPWSVKRR